MKIALAPRYRNLMIALFPTTLGLGTAVLWLYSLGWPLSIDEGGLTLRHHRRVHWYSIRKIAVSRSYLDGHVSEIRIHHEGGTNKIPVDRLQDGQDVVRIILAMFEHVNRARASQRRLQASPVRGLCAVDARIMPAKRQSGVADEHPYGNTENWAQELATLGKTLARQPEMIQKIANFARERT